MIPKCRLACLFRCLMVFRRRRERKNFISKICKIWKKKQQLLNRVWLHNPYLMHSTSSTNSFQILAQDSENISVVWYLQRVTLRCCGVHGYYLDFLFPIYETRALFCCGSTRSIFTLHLSICLFFFKKKNRNEDHHLHSEFIILSFFLARFWWQKKKKRNNRVWWSHFFLQPVCHCTQHLFISPFSRRRSVLFTFTPERLILISRWRLQRAKRVVDFFIFSTLSCVY